MNKLLKALVPVLSMSFLLLSFLHAQNGLITVTVRDEAGQPVPGAQITVGEGEEEYLTDEQGVFRFQVNTKTPVLIEAEGFESVLAIAYPLPLGMQDVVLIKNPYGLRGQDKVYVPFGELKSRQMTGAFTVIDPAEILKSDQESGYQGLLNGRVPGMLSANNLRGAGAPLVVIDGIIRPADAINVQQIEQISVVKDLSLSMLYGSQAQNGVILITTKRGEVLKKSIRIMAENGFNTPISYPEYLNSADYMSYYNQALQNDGLPALYTNEQIQNTRSGVNPVAYPDEDFYNATYLGNFSTSYRVVGETSGGNEVAQYYLNLGWNRQNSLLNLGEGKDEHTDYLNLRGNVNYKLNDFISIKFDGVFSLDLYKGPRYTGEDFWGLSTTLKPNYSPVLIPANLLPDTALVLNTAKLIDGKYLLGGTSEFRTNPYGELTLNGNTNTISRLMQINSGLDFNLNRLTPGLTGSAYLSFDISNGFSQSLNNSYAVYSNAFVLDTLIAEPTAIGVDAKQTTKDISNIDFYRRVGFYGTLNYQRTFNSVHAINANAVAYRDQFSTENVLQPAKHLHFGARANYMFNNKYIAELTGVVAGSSKLFENNRYQFSPGIGLGWILSEEDFFTSGMFNYLKIRTNWAMSHSDENLGYYLYQANYYTQGANWTYNYGSGSNRIRSAFAGNPLLGWEKTTEFNLGFEALMLDNQLYVEAGYFNTLASGLVQARDDFYPSYVSTNFNENYGKERNQGLELGLNLKKSVGKLKVSIGGNIMYAKPITLQTDELAYGEELEYLKRSGKALDAMFGYVALGLFSDSAEIAASPVQTFGIVRPGDIKYQDLNGDNIIDNLDVKMIGNSRSRIGYGLNLSIDYGKLNFFALGTGQAGGNVYYNDAYYWVYGTRKYSKTVLDAWTPGNADEAKYPRLSTTTSNNNFRNSTYWIETRDWFKLQVVQLNYQLFAGNQSLKDARVFVRGSNLVTISKNKDKFLLNVGSAPQMRYFSVGVNAAF
jgi:TonB-linked SusC/RagA family outer membrane protein